MREWLNATIEEVEFSETKHGDKPELPFDGALYSNGKPYGADNNGSN
jgi:hypothetical protein